VARSGLRAGTVGETSQVLRLLLRRWPILLVGIALGVGGGILASNLMPPSYSSSSYVLVVPVRNADGSNAINYAQAYARIATNQAVVAKALIDNGIAVEPGRIRQLVSVSASPDAPLIEITARDRQPERAARLANVVAQGLSSYSDARAQDTGYRVRQFTRALPPSRTSSPNRVLNTIVGVSIGLLLAGLLALNLPSRRSRRRWQEVLGAYGYPVVAKLPRFRALGSAPEEELGYAGVRSATTRLLERIQAGLGGQVSGVLVVTSPHGGDGKTTISRLLYGLLAEQGRQVLFADAVRQRFLVAGRSEEYSASEQQLSEAGFARFVDGLRSDCDVLIVDAQPLTRPAELRELLPLAEAMLVVVGHRNPGYRLQEALPTIDEIAPPFVGIVLNQPGRKLISAKPGRREPPEEQYGPRVAS
jgi:capsular polysaccharide biosynthesis protein